MLAQRPADEADAELIFQMLREGLEAYVIQTWGAWDDADQRKRFAESTDLSTHVVLESGGVSVGCMSVSRAASEIKLNRLFILPAFQNRGLGTAALLGVLREADEAGLPVRLSVLRVNPARRLYERHGFAVTQEDASHFFMIRPCERTA